MAPTATTSASKKYKLKAWAAGDGPPPCAFFISAAGCRNGDSCKFSHELAAAKDAGSVVSSESEPEREEMEEVEAKVPAAVAVVPVAEPNKKKKTKKNQQEQPVETAAAAAAGDKRKATTPTAASSDAFPFANPKKQKSSTPTPTPAAVAAATVPAAAKTAPPKQEKAAAVAAPPVQKEKKTPKPAPAPTASKTDAAASAAPSFRNLLKELPIAAFVMPSEKKAADKPADAAPPSPPPQSSSDSDDADQLPLPTSHPDSRRWLTAVQEGQKHPRFLRDYNFTKYQDEDEDAGFIGKKAWIQAPKYDAAKHKDLPQVIAMDCEMCETQDPVSGKKDSRALCRISVVDAVTDEVLLDTLVKPSWPVTDYRSWINGIVAADLEPVQFTLRHAQAFMMALCSEETVILGHALQNDLAAIRMEHYCVGDSAYLFAAKDSPSASVSLKDLAASILKTTMPNKHDSVNDARTAWKCLEHYLESDGKVEPVERTPRGPKHGGNGSSYGMQLFVHRIPKSCDESHLMQMFVAYACVQPDKVDAIEFNGDFGKTIAHFRTVSHANVAFDSIEGKADADPSGRLQKKVFLKNGGYIRVRKMAYEGKREDRAAGEKEPPRRSSTG